LTSGRSKRFGGSQFDPWNEQIMDDTVRALWIKQSDGNRLDRQLRAAHVGLGGIAPKDELEGMMAAQLIASYSAAMECYRRAMLGEQTFEARRENLTQANKLSRTYAALTEALDRHRGKGQQRITVEHVNVHAGGQAIVGAVTSRGGGRQQSEQLTDATREITHEPGSPMRSPDSARATMPIASSAGKRRCRMHGGAAGSGAPLGNTNALRLGHYTTEAIARRR